MLRRNNVVLNPAADTKLTEGDVVIVFDDSALKKVFGATGVGVFAGPSAIEREIVDQYGVEVIGRTDEVRERFYAVSVERRLQHPAIVAISEHARGRLFKTDRDDEAESAAG